MVRLYSKMLTKYLRFLILVFMLFTVVFMAFIVNLPSFYYSAYNLSIKNKQYKLSAIFLERQIKRLENNNSESLNDPMIPMLRYNLCKIYIYGVHDYETAISKLKYLKERYPVECKRWSCNMELSYCYYKIGKHNKAYYILKEDPIGKNVDDFDQYKLKMVKFDRLRQKYYYFPEY